MPKISIVVPVYNVQKYIRDCLESLVNQTFSDIEIIIVDDGSPDESYKVYGEFASKDSRIRIIKKKMLVFLKRGIRGSVLQTENS